MKLWIALLTFAIMGFAACSSSENNSAAQKKLDEWFSQELEVLKPLNQQDEDAKISSANPIFIRDRKDEDLEISLIWNPNLPNGGLTKAQVTQALDAAKIQLKYARALVSALHNASFPKVAVGVNQGQYLVLAYENPFTSIFSTRMKQFAAGIKTWAPTVGLSDLPLKLLFVDPKTQNQQSFQTIIPIQILNATPTVFFDNTYLEATANAAFSQSLEEMAGTVNLTGAMANAIRKKAHNEATKYASAQAQQAVALELETMVSIDLNMRTMDRITYRFPYCKKSSSNSKTSCEGHFDGWISCSYNLKTDAVEEFTNEGSILF